MQLNSKDILDLEKIYRLNLINSVSGVKPAVLVSTLSKSGTSNLAIFSSVFHLGSNPPLLGMISRPDMEVSRDTLDYIKEKGFYTLNHLPSTHSQNGHYTSAKFGKDVSEYQECGFTELYAEGFEIPFVAESPIKLGMQLEQILPIEANGTVLIIGKIIKLIVEDALVDDEGQVNLQEAKTTGVSGLNTYYTLNKLAAYPYARVSELPDFG